MYMMYTILNLYGYVYFVGYLILIRWDIARFNFYFLSIVEVVTSFLALKYKDKIYLKLLILQYSFNSYQK